MNSLCCPKCERKAIRGALVWSLLNYDKSRSLLKSLGKFKDTDEVHYCDYCKIWWVYPEAPNALVNIINKIYKYSNEN